MPSQNLRNRLKYALAQRAAANELVSMLLGANPFATHWYVDTFSGSDTLHDGQSSDKAFATMGQALTSAATGDVIWMKGDVREELTGSNLKFDITIIGALSQHHPDQPSSAYDPGASMWRPPASPTSSTPLLELRGRGWKFINIAFDCPVDAAAVYAVSNASSGTDEYDASHCTFINCSFQQGLRAFQDNGGLTNVSFIDCRFRILSPSGACAIENTSTSVRLPQNWLIQNCTFYGVGAGGGNECHIDAPLSGSVIRDCTFGLVEGTDLYIDLTGGDDNQVTGNLLEGDYTTADYVAGTNDDWTGNFNSNTSETEVGDNGITIAVPASP